MKKQKLSTVLMALLLVLAFNLPAFSQDEKTPAPQENTGVNSQTAEDDAQADIEDPQGSADMVDDDSPMCNMPGMNYNMMSQKPAGGMCGPNCRCANCMMKKGRMGMMGMGMMRKPGFGGMGMMMAGQGMVRSCRMPDFYLRNRDYLGLSPEQAAKLKKLDFTMREDGILKGAKVKALELELAEVVASPDFKVDDAISKMKDVEAARVDLRTAMIKIAAGARDILSPKQLGKLNDINLGAGGMCGKMCGTKGGMKDNMRKKMMEKMMP